MFQLRNFAKLQLLLICLILSLKLFGTQMEKSINLVTKSLNLRGALSCDVTDPTRRQHLIKIFPGVAMWDRGRQFKVDLKISNKIN